MEFLDRRLKSKDLSLLSKFPLLAITGPRQSGKTTFAKRLKPDYAYVNLELSEERSFAKNDPLGFLWTYQNGVILYEFLTAIEIKSSETYHSDFLKGLKYFRKIAPDTDLKLIYGGKLNQEREGIEITNIWNL